MGFSGAVSGVGLLLITYLVIGKMFKRKPSYRGKSIIITGASSGIGEELAIMYAAMGAKLVLAARRTEMLKSVAERCKQAGALDVVVVETDVTKESDCKNLIEVTAKKFGEIDLLVLNAGMGLLMTMKETVDLQPYRTIMDINFWGYVYPTFSLLTLFAKISWNNSFGKLFSSKIPNHKESRLCCY